MVSSRFRTAADPYVSYLVRPIVRMGVSPSLITVTGLGFSMVAAYLLASSNLIFAAIALILSSILDVADGAVARLTGRVSPFGGFLDSLSDRYSDSIILLGIAIFLQGHYLLIMVVLVGSLLVSYTRARAEMEIEKCSVGFGERAERLLIIIAAILIQGLGLIENAVYLALILLALLTHLTVAQRILFTYRKLAV